MVVRRHAPATTRNRAPIAEVLRDVLPAAGLVLEVASGTGEHAAWFASQFPSLTWQPTDAAPEALPSIAEWARASGVNNVLPPLHLDVTADDWPVENTDAVLCINMVHISPWQATLGLLANSAKLLPVGGPLILYGPYFRDAVETAPSNLAFDADLKARNPAWGIRRLEDVTAAARGVGLALDRVVEMPANNLSLVYRRG